MKLLDCGVLYILGISMYLVFSDAEGESTVFGCTPFTFEGQDALMKNTTATSIVRCSSQTAKENATRFIYDGKICVLLGVGLTTSRTNGSDTDILCYEQLPANEMEEVTASNNTAYSSSSFDDANLPEKALDGVLSSVFVSASSDEKPWWIVDLGEVREVWSLSVVARPSLHPERLHNIEVRGGTELNLDGDFSSWILMTFYKGPYSAAQNVLTLNVNGINARYISIQIIKTGSGYLQLSEVKVMAKRT